MKKRLKVYFEKLGVDFEVEMVGTTKTGPILEMIKPIIKPLTDLLKGNNQDTEKMITSFLYNIDEQDIQKMETYIFTNYIFYNDMPFSFSADKLLTSPFIDIYIIIEYYKAFIIPQLETLSSIMAGMNQETKKEDKVNLTQKKI